MKETNVEITIIERKTIRKKQEKVKALKRKKGITLVALIVTILLSYDEKIKCGNSKGFVTILLSYDEKIKCGNSKGFILTRIKNFGQMYLTNWKILY